MYRMLPLLNGCPVKCHGEFDSPLRFGNFVLRHSMIVGDLDVCEGILAIDVLNNHEGVLNLGGGYLGLGGHIICVSLNQMQEDDWVWYFYPPKTKQKLGQGWTAPYLVTHEASDVLYKIKTSSSSRHKIVHVDNLCRYEAETMPTDW